VLPTPKEQIRTSNCPAWKRSTTSCRSWRQQRRGEERKGREGRGEEGREDRGGKTAEEGRGGKTEEGREEREEGSYGLFDNVSSDVSWTNLPPSRRCCVWEVQWSEGKGREKGGKKWIPVSRRRWIKLMAVSRNQTKITIGESGFSSSNRNTSDAVKGTWVEDKGEMGERREEWGREKEERGGSGKAQQRQNKGKNRGEGVPVP
jgi:hypothetical protein